MEMEITKYLVDYKAKSTSVEVLHTTTGAFGADRRADTIVIPRIESWTIATLQAAVIEMAAAVRAEKVAAVATEIMTDAVKFSIPLEVHPLEVVK